MSYGAARSGQPRRLPLEGCYNFRDLGGYATPEGATVRRGRLFRSDAFGNVTEWDRRALAQLGLVTVIDLRRVGEHEVPGGDVLGVGHGYRHLPLFDEAPSMAEIAT